MSYATVADRAIDYHRCRYGTSRLRFRGPPADLDEPFIAFLGGSETFGRFVAQPFPDLVGLETGVTTLNLGCPNAGVDVFNEDPTVLELSRKAQLRVIQVAGAQNLSNRLYTVHPRRNDRFIRASRFLKVLYKGIDLTEVHFTGHLLSLLQQEAPDRFEMIVNELRAAWSSRMASLIERVGAPTMLLWVATRAPEAEKRMHSDAPLFIDRAMLTSLCKPGVTLTEVVVPAAQLRSTEGMVYSELDVAAAQDLPGPTVHRAIAEALVANLPRQRRL